jgi:uncharacterized protein YggU (UPF0235/DUF167 family)
MKWSVMIDREASKTDFVKVDARDGSFSATIDAQCVDGRAVYNIVAYVGNERDKSKNTALAIEYASIHGWI